MINKIVKNRPPLLGSLAIGLVLGAFSVAVVVVTRSVTWLTHYETTITERGFPLPVYISSETTNTVTGSNAANSSFDGINLTIDILLWTFLALILGWVMKLTIFSNVDNRD